MRMAIRAVVDAGAVAEGCLCYSGNCQSPTETKFTVDYYLGVAAELIDAGVHMLCIKDMAGLGTPGSMRLLVGALRKAYPAMPVHVHVHDTAGMGVATYMAVAAAGGDVVDLASDSMSGLTSQPSMGAFLASADTDIAFESIEPLSRYWAGVRELYGCFNPGVVATSSAVLRTQIPGGQMSNLVFQSRALGLSQWDAVQEHYVQANILCGNPIKVTPSSKVVGDLGLWMLANGFDTAAKLRAKIFAESVDLPASVIAFFRGELGQPHDGFDTELRRRILDGAGVGEVQGLAGAAMPPYDFAAAEAELTADFGAWIRPEDAISYALYPKVFRDYAKHRSEWGKVTHLPTRLFLGAMKPGKEERIIFGRGVDLRVTLVATSAVPDDKGLVVVVLQVNGQYATVRVRDRGVETESGPALPLAEPDNDTHCAASMPGMLAAVKVAVGDVVAAGDTVCMLSAMKMETAVSCKVAGKVSAVHVAVGDVVSAGDLLVVVTPA